MSNKLDDVYKQLPASLKKCIDITCKKDGSLLFSFENMAMPYTNEHLLMHFAFIMSGDQLIFLLIVSVEKPLYY